MKFIGTEVLYKLDEKTGEMIEVGTANTFMKNYDSRKKGFMITYMMELFTMIDALGNKKIKIVKYIIENMEKTSNTLIKTTREIAKETNASRQTVIDTLKILEEHGLIMRKTGAIMLNPKLVNNRNAKGEALMLVRFQEFSDNDDDWDNY